MWLSLLMVACGPDTGPSPEELAAMPKPGPPRVDAPPANPPRSMPPPPPAVKVTPTFELGGATSDAPRAVVLISLDTVRADRLAVYGGRAETPTLSALAARGARFDNAISHFPETALSHWAMLTGVLPEVHGNVPGNRGSRCSAPTVAEIARRSKIPTAAFIGGVTLTDGSSGLSRGFDVYDDRFPLDTADMKRPGQEVTRRAVDWIEKQDGAYFAFVHYFDAHFPYTPSPPWDTRYDPGYTGALTGSDADLRPYRDGEKQPSAADVAHVLALYDGELSELDALIAPVIAAAGEDAIVMVTADHGESFEHGYYFNHRAGLWDSVLRVPWIVAGPGIPENVAISEQVGLTDVAPTVLALMGLPSDTRAHGASRVPLMTGGSGHADTVYAITDPWMAGFQFAARTAEHKLLERDGKIEIFEHAGDPAEEAPRALVPPYLMGAQGTYQQIVARAKDCQVPVTAAPLSAPECARLRALGYIEDGCE